MKADEYEKTAAILGQIAKQFKRGSKERKVLKLCGQSLFFAFSHEVRNEFLEFANNKGDLRGRDIMYLKLNRLEIPLKHKTAAVVELESEIDLLVAKIDKFLSCVDEK